MEAVANPSIHRTGILQWSSKTLVVLAGRYAAVMLNRSAMERRNMKKFLLMLAMSILFKGTVQAGNASNQPNYDSLRERGRALYSQLLKFKRDQDFVLNGFGYSNSNNRYKKWRTEAQALDDSCRAELDRLSGLEAKINSDLFPLCTATTDLTSLAVRYAVGGGKEDKYTRAMKSEIEKEFRYLNHNGTNSK